jgi:hypothetical protein
MVGPTTRLGDDGKVLKYQEWASKRESRETLTLSSAYAHPAREVRLLKRRGLGEYKIELVAETCRFDDCPPKIPDVLMHKRS